MNGVAYVRVSGDLHEDLDGLRDLLDAIDELIRRLRSGEKPRLSRRLHDAHGVLCVEPSAFEICITCEMTDARRHLTGAAGVEPLSREHVQVRTRDHERRRHLLNLTTARVVLCDWVEDHVRDGAADLPAQPAACHRAQRTECGAECTTDDGAADPE